MKVTIRKGVFETNSSSVHTITIKKNSKRNYPEELVFEAGEFGWERETYDSPTMKASYLYTFICENLSKSDDLIESMNTVKGALEKIAAVLNEVGVKAVFTKSYGYNYIDHGDELWGFFNDIINDKELLLDYLFGDSVLETGNDNEDYDFYPDYGDPKRHSNSDDEYSYTKPN